jgi:hypothetical protein
MIFRVVLITLLMAVSSFALDRVKDFGVWSDLDKDCQSTREEVLISLGDSLTLNKCSVKDGVWVDFYTNKILRDKKLIDIDHIVSLKDAERSGALKWGRDKMVAFANDFENLVVTHRSINRGKSDKTPLEWSPKQNYCKYIEKYIRVKSKYKLQIDPRILENKTLLCK